MTLGGPNKRQVMYYVDIAIVSNPLRSPCTLSVEAAGDSFFCRGGYVVCQPRP
jgi:hypothetical protein